MRLAEKRISRKLTDMPCRASVTGCRKRNAKSISWAFPLGGCCRMGTKYELYYSTKEALENMLDVIAVGIEKQRRELKERQCYMGS